MAEDPKKKIKDLNEELGYFEDQVLSIADLLSRTIKDAIDDIRDSASGVADIFEKRLSKSIRDFSKSSDAILSNQLKIYQGSIKQSDIVKTQNGLELKRLSILRNIENLKKQGIRIDAEQIAQLEEAYETQLALLESQTKEAKKIQHNMGITGNIIKGISKIPVLGNFLDAEEALSAAQLSAAKSGSGRAKVMGAAFKQLGSTLKNSLTDPMIWLGLSLKLFKELLGMGLAFSQRTAEIARNLGISSSEAQILNQRFSDLTASSNNLLVTQKSLLKATTEINDKFGTSAMLTESMLQGQIDLTERLGLTGEEAATYAEYSLLTGQSQESIVNSIGKQNKGILNNKKVIQEVAKTSGQLAAQYKNNPRLIAQAVMQAQKLGMTLEQASNSSRNLLNFEESISAELEAELLTGMDLNLEKARYLALQGRSAEAAEELMKNLGPNGLEKFQRMNVLQQDALAKSLGMNADELADSLRTQKAINALGPENRRAYKEAIKAAQDKGDFERAAALEKQMNQGKEFKLAEINLDAQTKFNKAVERLKGLLASIVEGPLGQMADKIMSMVEKILKIPMLKEALKYAAPMAALLTGGLLIKSLVKGSTPFTPTYVREVGGGMGGGGGISDLFGGGGGGKGGGGKTAWGGKPPKGFKFPKNAGSMGKLSKLAKGAGWLSVLGAGIDLTSNLTDESLSAGDAALKTLDQNKFTALGAGIGALFGGVGAIPGAAIGGLIDFAVGQTAPNEGLIGTYSKSPGELAMAAQSTNITSTSNSPQLERIERHLANIASKEGNVYLGPTKVGTAVTVGTYKTQ